MKKQYVYNTATIDSDGKNIVINSFVKTAIEGKVILILIMSLYVLYTTILFATFPVSEGNNGFVFIIVLLGVLILYFLGKRFLWNTFGVETVVINTKSISYQYDYGILRTTLTTIPYKELKVSYEKVKDIGDIEYGNLYFIDYDEVNLPNRIFETTVLLSKNDAEIVFKMLHALFHIEFADKFNLPPFSPN